MKGKIQNLQRENLYTIYIASWDYLLRKWRPAYLNSLQCISYNVSPKESTESKLIFIMIPSSSTVWAHKVATINYSGKFTSTEKTVSYSAMMPVK